MTGIEVHLQGIADAVRKRAKATSKPAAQKCDCAKSDCEECSPDECECEPPEEEDDEEEVVSKSIEIPIAKANTEEQTVTGIVLQPEVVDAHGDIMSADVIRKTAHEFLMNFNKNTKLGVQHSSFPAGKLALCECFIAPSNMVIGSSSVKQGSWIMTVKVLDSGLWKKVKDGNITGFSIGGKAKTVSVAKP